jgi:hypothetical protein
MHRRRLVPLLLAAALVASVAAWRAGFAASLPLSSGHLWSGTQSLAKGTCTLSGRGETTDAWVDRSSPGSSNGGATLEVQRRNRRDRWAFVRFDLSSCGIPTSGGADSATLTLTMSGAPGRSRTLTLAPVLSSWGTALTWTQAQSLSYGAPTTTFATGTSSGASFDLTVTALVDAAIKSPGSSFGWRIDDAGGSSSRSALAFDSSSGGSPPTLTIRWER